MTIHAEATLHLLTPEEGGRKSPFMSGYPPQFHFSGEVPGWVIDIAQCDPDPFPPGAEGTVALTFLSWETVRSRIQVGTTFEFKEGYRVLGSGTITTVLQE